MKVKIEIYLGILFLSIMHSVIFIYYATSIGHQPEGIREFDLMLLVNAIIIGGFTYAGLFFINEAIYKDFGDKKVLGFRVVNTTFLLLGAAVTGVSLVASVYVL